MKKGVSCEITYDAAGNGRDKNNKVAGIHDITS